MLLALVGFAFAGCPATEAGLVADARRVRAAFTAMDASGLDRAVEALDVDAGCLSEAVTPATAARVHEAFGLAAFVRGDSDAAALAFAAARAADPDWAPDRSGLPAGHPVFELAERVDPASLARRTLRPPATGELLLDGRASLRRPTEAPTLAQWVVDGDVSASRYVLPDAAMIPYDAVIPERSAGARVPAEAPSRRRGQSIPWWIGAGAGLALSGASFVAAADARGRWEASDDPDAVGRLYTTNHAFAGAGVGLAVVGLGCGVGAVVSTSW